MNKKAIICCLIALCILIVGIFYIDNIYKPQSQLPSINSNLESGNTKYNEAVGYINNENYEKATQSIDESLTNYNKAKNDTQIALNKSINRNDTVLTQYFNYTLDELDMKINAANEMKNGLALINPNDYSLSKEHFNKSNEIMQNTTQYNDRREELENQNPDKFTEK